MANRQNRIVISKRRKTNEVNPKSTPAYCPESIFRPLCRKETQIEPDNLTTLRGQSLEFREAKVANIFRVPGRMELYTKRTMELSRKTVSRFCQS